MADRKELKAEKERIEKRMEEIKEELKHPLLSECKWVKGRRDFEGGVTLREHSFNIVTDKNNNVVGYFAAPWMADVFIGVPALVRACDEFCALPAGAGRDGIRSALKAIKSRGN